MGAIAPLGCKTGLDKWMGWRQPPCRDVQGPAGSAHLPTPSGIFCHCPSLALFLPHQPLCVFLKLMSTSCLLGLLPFPPITGLQASDGQDGSTDRPVVYQRRSCTPPTQSVHHTKPRDPVLIHVSLLDMACSLSWWLFVP